MPLASARDFCFALGLATALAAASAAHAASDLDRAYRIIAGKRFVDLTHAFSPTTPVWSGFGQAKFTPAADPNTKKAADDLATCGFAQD